MSALHDRTQPSPPSAAEYERMQAAPEFVELRRSFRAFAFPMTGIFLAWYFLYVLLSTFAQDFMSTKVWGNINVGLLFGLGQFASTFLITWLYVRHANRRLDPTAERIRDELEGAGAVAAAPAGTTAGPRADGSGTTGDGTEVTR
jgi:uncharacterized membrane protein (DUF485 family)